MDLKYLNLFNTYCVFTHLGDTLGGGVFGGLGWGSVVVNPYTFACVCTWTHTPTLCAHMHVKHDKHVSLHGGIHLQFVNMFMHANLCICF